MLYLMMLRITSVLSTPQKQVVCIPERSWLKASAYGSRPDVPDGLVHHMLIRADNRAASESGHLRHASARLIVDISHYYKIYHLRAR